MDQYLWKLRTTEPPSPAASTPPILGRPHGSAVSRPSRASTKRTSTRPTLSRKSTGFGERYSFLPPSPSEPVLFGPRDKDFEKKRSRSVRTDKGKSDRSSSSTGAVNCCPPKFRRAFTWAGGGSREGSTDSQDRSAHQQRQGLDGAVDEGGD